MTLSNRSILVTLVCVAGLASCGDPSAPGGGTQIPDGTVVLTFDDAIRNHLTLVAPLLQKHGFGASFFITERGMGVSDAYLSWPEVAELGRRGFEIGNHTSAHMDLSEPGVAWMLERDSERMESRFRQNGIPPPTSFAWPGSAFGPEGVEHLRERGYRFARRGSRPERSPHSEEPGPAYDSSRNSPLLIPSAEVESDWTMERFEKTVALARGGRAVVLQFHGVPDPFNGVVSVTPERFREYLQVLATRATRVVALRDLARWVDPDAASQDPLLGTRWPAAQH